MLKQPMNTWPRRLWRTHAVWIEAVLAVLLVMLAAAGPALAEGAAPTAAPVARPDVLAGRPAAAGIDGQPGAVVPSPCGLDSEAALAAVRQQRLRGGADARLAVR